MRWKDIWDLYIQRSVVYSSERSLYPWINWSYCLITFYLCVVLCIFKLSCYIVLVDTRFVSFLEPWGFRLDLLFSQRSLPTCQHFDFQYWRLGSQSNGLPRAQLHGVSTRYLGKPRTLGIITVQILTKNCISLYM